MRAMKRTMKKTLSLLLVVIMLLTTLPAVSAATTLPFNDVKEGTWYYANVEYVYEKGLMVGVSADKFAPNSTLTRAMLVTVLWRMSGAPTAGDSNFKDVPKGSWYSTAVAWAEENQIVMGYNGETFGPNDKITREQMAAMFYRYAGFVSADTTATTELTKFTDAADTSTWAQTSMKWAVAVGLIQGVAADKLSPRGNATRAQVAAILMRFDMSLVDDATDHESEIVTENDEFILTANVKEVRISEKTDVKFFVNTTLTVESFTLYKDGNNTGVILHDDGKGDDDIPSDGCYTAVYSLQEENAGEVSFTASTTVKETPVTTDVYSITVFAPFTEEEVNLIVSIQSDIQEILKTVNDANPGVSEDELALLRYDAVWAYLQEKLEAGVIQDLQYDSEEKTVYFWYNGVEYAVECYDSFSYEDNIDYPSTPTIKAPLHEGNFYSDSFSTGSITHRDIIDNPDYITYKERAIVLCYGPEDATDNPWLAASSNNVTYKLDAAGFDTSLVFNATVNDYKGLGDYDFIYVESHGNTSGWLSKKTPVICTNQIVTPDNLNEYSADIRAERIKATTLTSGETKYWIYPSFFTFHYSTQPLKANIVSLGCCKGAKNTKLVNALIESGAKAVTAYSETVYTQYDAYMMDSMIDSLLDGKWIGQALNIAKEQYGENDLVYAKAQNWSNIKSEKAVCGVYGNAATGIHSSLQNGNFDFLLNDWHIYGDARRINRLSGITPTTPLSMAIISTGFGSMNDSTTSAIYQTVLVPDNAIDLEFSYDIVSEEPMEYVGSEYNDYFRMDILNTSGEVLESFAYESVNTSTWYAITGIDFPGGDDTTYHTRWKTISGDISKYRGQLIVIRFVVKDAGDSIYDTAALIDGIYITDH